MITGASSHCAATIAVVLLALACTYLVRAQELRPLPALEFDLAAGSATVLAPQEGPYPGIVRELAEALKGATGTEPRIVPDATDPTTLGSEPLIVLGNAMHSAAARRLYFGAYDLTDYSFPSPGGHVLRTIRDPFGTGAHVLLVGGSDADGVRAAARRLVGRVAADGPKLGYVNEVELGEWRDGIIGYTSQYLGDDDKIWHRTGQSGSWDYMIAIARAGIGYLRTGDEAYLPVFRREVLRFFEHDVYHPTDEAPTMIHGFVNTQIIVWDLIRDHPFFTDEDRAQIDGGFLHICRSGEGPGRIKSAAERRVIRDNHGTRNALDAYFCGRYFSRRFGLAEAQEWLDIAERYFAPQMESAKPTEDSWGHQWAASLFNTLVYALATDRQDYLTSDALRRAADRALIGHGHGGPAGYLAACAMATGDTGYLSLEADAESAARRRATMSSHGDEYLRAFCTGEEIERRQGLLGVTIAPVDELWRETIDEAGWNPGGLFVTTAPAETAFDKASVREGWADDDFYLLFDGISGGQHSYQDANCVVGFRERGVNWMNPRRTFQTSVTVRTQNGVFVALDAEGPGRLHRYARLLYADEANGYTALGGALAGLGPVNWERHVLRKRGQWTLVIDRLVTKRPGEILAERHWHIAGSVEARPDGLVSSVKRGEQTVSLHLQTAGLPEGGMSGTTDRVELVRARATPEEPLELATLLHVRSDGEPPAHGLTRTTGGWRVSDGQAGVVVAAADRPERGLHVLGGQKPVVIGEAPALSDGEARALTEAADAVARPGLPLRPSAPGIELPWRKLDAGAPVTAVAHGDGLIAAGTHDGAAVLWDGERERWRARFGSPIHSLHIRGDEVIVGEERGALSRVGADGKTAWTVEIPYVPMPWPYWSEGRSRIREIDAADLDGDGAPEVLASNSDRRVYAFSVDGRKLWTRPIQWGIYTAMTPTQHQGEFALMGGTSRPSIHGWCILIGADGSLRGHLSRPDLTSWSLPAQFRDMRVIDADGDGADEFLCAIDTNCRQVVLYDQEGKVVWDADMAGAATGLALAEHDGARRVLCASSSGYIVALDAATGERAWACYTGEAADYVGALSDGRTLAVCPAGRVFVIDAAGSLLGQCDLGSPITALLRPGSHRAGRPPIIAGAQDGTVWAVGP